MKNCAQKGRWAKCPQMATVLGININPSSTDDCATGVALLERFRPSTEGGGVNLSTDLDLESPSRHTASHTCEGISGDAGLRREELP